MVDDENHTTRATRAAKLGISPDELATAERELGTFLDELDGRLKRELAAGSYTTIETSADSKALVDKIIAKSRAMRAVKAD